ncbi:MAG: alpha/beta hydrolase [Deltaproteobacteria bacterium]|nr:alpha/beta hydrolase [Deltaproteobacteria bacterium]
MTELSGFPFFEVEFDKKGAVDDPQQAQAVVDFVASGEVTDLFVFSHGWNNDLAEARELYGNLCLQLKERRGAGSGGGLPGRKLAVLGVFWPSKKFADKELIPSGAASADGGLRDRDLEEQLAELEGVFDAEDESGRLLEAKDLIPDLEDRASARRQFVDLLRGALGGVESLDEEIREELPDPFFDLDGSDLLKKFGQATVGASLAAGGGAAGVSASPGGAAGLGGFFGGVRAGARNFLNYLTYYQMKKRAGVVARAGVHETLAQIRDSSPEVKLHLVGHSFGGRLVAAAAKGPEGASAIVLDSLTLLQAAFSHNGFSQKFDGENDGFFRLVVTDRRVKGPILVSHTKNDKAVGIAYPLASRIAGQQAAGLGDEKDPFGGIGRNGAQKTPEALDEALLEVSGNYSFQAGKIHNLQADDHISSHSDIAKAEVAHAILEAVATVG